LHSIESFLINKRIFILSVRFLKETDHDWAYWSIDGYKYPGKKYTRRNLKSIQSPSILSQLVLNFGNCTAMGLDGTLAEAMHIKCPKCIF
jgi:hypothetical protein